jgi:hypothetical protein
LVCNLCFSLLVLGYGQTGTFLYNILSSCSYAVYRIVNFSNLLVPLCCNKLRFCTYKHTYICLQCENIVELQLGTQT